MPIDDLERDGWEVIDSFGGEFIMAREKQRIVVDKDGEIIFTY